MAYVKKRSVVALELQCCCGIRTGIGQYTMKLAQNLHQTEKLSFKGRLFNFIGKNDNSAVTDSLEFAVDVNKLVPYSIYRRIFNILPVPYSLMFPKADLSIFFNYIVPPGTEGKVISVIHDMAYIRYPETLNASNLRRLKNGIAGSISRSDHIIAVSEFTKREIVELLGVPEDKISVLYCAASLSDETGDFEDLRKKYCIDMPYILYMGTIEPRKNLVRLIKAYEKLRELPGRQVKLVLAGGNGWKNDEIYAAAAASRFSDDIVFTGYVSAAEKNLLYRNAEFLSFISLYEGFGMPLAEAMSLGCPILCSREASLPEIAGNAALYVDAYDIDGIKDGMDKLLGTPELADELRINGYERVNNFSWEKSSAKLVEICERVLELN